MLLVYRSIIIIVLFTCSNVILLGQDASLDGEVHLTLSQALKRGISKEKKKNTDPDPAKDIVIVLRVKQGQWDVKVWGWLVDYNRSDHIGTVENIKHIKDEISFDIKMNITPDLWVEGGEAKWHVVLNRKGNQFTGYYSGAFLTHQQTRAKAKAYLRPAWPTFSQHEVNWPKPGSHPRLFLTQEQIPQLRAFAKTHHGQAIVNKLKTMIESDAAYKDPEKFGHYVAGVAVMYTLTGDQKWADKAKELCKGVVNSELGGGLWSSNQKAILRAYFTYGITLAYDLCYNAWDEEFRQWMTIKLEDKAMREIKGGGKGYNTSPRSNWQAITKGAAGLAALTIMNDPRPFLHDKPISPDKTPSLKAFTPTDAKAGEYTNELKLGEIPTRWLMAGPLPLNDKADYFQNKQGNNIFFIKHGHVLKHDGNSYAFKTMPKEFNEESGLEINNAAERKPNSTLIYYAILPSG